MNNIEKMAAELRKSLNPHGARDLVDGAFQPIFKVPR